MKTFRTALLAVSVTCVSLAPVTGLAQSEQKPADATYKPSLGQYGRDVMWLPTADSLVNRMLDMAKVTPNDFVIDLGSGDGRTVITAGARGVPAHGIEYNANLVGYARRNAEAAGLADKVSFAQGDIFESDFSKATVVTMFLLPELNLRLRPILLNMKPGTRVVSNTFDMDDWEPDQRVETTEGCTTYCRAMMWIVPAKVEGTWRLPQGDLKLSQTYQKLSGTLTLDGRQMSISTGAMKGDTISFTAGGETYGGKVDGDSIIFSQTPGGAQMTATRVAADAK
jgi:hypothetical protein